MKQNIPVFLGLLILVSYGFAQEGHCQQEKMYEQKAMMQMHMIDLSEEQRMELENSKYELEKKTIELKADIELKYLDFQKEIKSDNPNRSKLMKLAEDISKLELKIKQLKIDHKLKMHSMLTPEQREQLKHHKPEIMVKKKIIKKNCEEDCQD